MMKVNRRTAPAAFAGALAARAADSGTPPRPGYQANGWDLDPKQFDLLLTAGGRLPDAP